MRDRQHVAERIVLIDEAHALNSKHQLVTKKLAEKHFSGYFMSATSEQGTTDKNPNAQIIDSVMGEKWSGDNVDPINTIFEFMPTGARLFLHLFHTKRAVSNFLKEIGNEANQQKFAESGLRTTLYPLVAGHRVRPGPLEVQL